MFWDKEFETMPLEALKDFQLKQLQQTVAWVYERVPYYKNKLDDLGIKPQDIRVLADLARLPFSVKNDLRDNYPFGLCAVPMTEVVRIHASSGTTGKPITGPYTAEDLEQWSDCMARNLYAVGVRSNDILQNSYGMGLFTGGLGFHQGATKVGVAVIPTSSGQTERQITIMQDFGTTVLCCTPSYALTIAEKGYQMGVNFKNLRLRAGIFGAEPWTREMRKEIEERLDIKAYEAYGLTPEGTKGELVFTAIRRRAMPLLRYRTRDITMLKRGKCECGRTLIKMEKVYGRSDDMLIISGVNVFPSQIESLLLDQKGIEPQYVIIVRKKGYLDTLEVNVEARPEIYQAGAEKIKEVEQRIEAHMRGLIGIGIKIRLVSPGTIARSEGKAKRVIDERKL
ncbi:MAG: phenylacetate--CoA ligase [Deltaproteobacteria bacterium]|nr:phenylacetate--CoA ligase [Deltaproteobacteria bacterium]